MVPDDQQQSAEAPLILDGQEYYWSDEWQAGELESLAGLSAGLGQIFETSEAALRFLFATD